MKGFIEGRSSFAVSKAYVGAEIEEKLYELRGVKDDAAYDSAMDRSIARLIPPVRVGLTRTEGLSQGREEHRQFRWSTQARGAGCVEVSAASGAGEKGRLK